jgi:hypothetical protein
VCCDSIASDWVMKASSCCQFGWLLCSLFCGKEIIEKSGRKRERERGKERVGGRVGGEEWKKRVESGERVLSLL